MDFLLGFGFRDVVDMAIVAVLLYAVLVWFKQTKAVFVAGGIFILGAVYIVASLLELTMTAWIFQGFFAIFLIVIIVIFQEELRSFFERLAVFSLGKKTSAQLADRQVEMLVQTLGDFAGAKNGALIVLKGKDPLERHLQAGYELGGRLSEPLLKSLFDPHSPGHDGAVIIEEDQITRFGCQLPLSKDYQKIQGLGTRHTAALGLTERSDALCLAVSEERGTISLSRNGELRVVTDLDALASAINAFLNEKAPMAPARWSAALFHTNTREKGLAAFLSFLLWGVFVSGSKVETRRLLLPVRFHDLPAGMTVERLYPPRVRAAVAGVRRDLYLLDPQDAYVSLDLSAMEEGIHEIVLSDRNFRLPPGVGVTEVEPASVKVQLLHGTMPALPEGKGGPGLKRLTAAEAEGLVRALPEVHKIAESVRGRGFRVVLKVESGPNPLIQSGGRQVYSVFVGEDRVTDVVRLMTFEVNAATREISVFDEDEDAVVPLASWRKKAP